MSDRKYVMSECRHATATSFVLRREDGSRTRRWRIVADGFRVLSGHEHYATEKLAWEATAKLLVKYYRLDRFA